MDNHIPCEHCGGDYQPSKLLRGLCPVCLFAQTLPGGEQDSDIARKTGTLPATRFVPPKINELAPFFPQLEILELTGQGGMSAVYKACQTHLNRTVALKVLPQEIAASDGGLERFQREAITLAQLSHPNIVHVHDAGQAGPWCFILMEYVAGPNLRQLLGESQLPSSDVLRIASAICDGLQYAHDQGVIHRDVKPENVLLDSSGNVKLVDFGLAKLLNPQPPQGAATRSGVVLGTPHYLAPEQVETPSRVDHRADVYSLGVLMYEMLTGELPLGHFQPPSQRIGSDPALDAVVLQAMSRDPQNRFQRACDVRAGMASAKSSKSTLRPIEQRPGWRQFANELFLSCCSILLGLIGCLSLVSAISVASHPSAISDNPKEFSAFSTSFSIAVTLLTFPFSFLLARVNVSSKTSWHNLSLPQAVCVPILVASYVALGAGLLVGPGLTIALFGAFPRFAVVESWIVFGRAFTEVDRTSFLTPYWLTIYGVGALVSAAWCILLTFLVRNRPALVRGVFHPSDEGTTAAMMRTIALWAVVILAPLGCLLLYASWLGNGPPG